MKEIELTGNAGSVGTRTIVPDLSTVQSLACTAQHSDKRQFSELFFGFMVVVTSFAALLLLSACTGSGTLSAPSIGTLLSPDGSVKSADSNTANPAADSLEARLTAVEGPAERPAGSPATPTLRQKSGTSASRSALALAPAQKAPAQRAVDQIAGQSGSLNPKKLKPSEPALEQASLTPQETKAAPKKSGGFFSGLFKKNRTKTSRNSNNRGITVRTGVRDRSNRPRWNTSALPGVRGKSLFGIDGEEVDEFDQPIRMASVTNRARRGSHGLLLQRDDVKVSCFPPNLVRLLKMVERRFGRTPLVTSGYRSRSHNRLIRGARNSMHIKCQAADIQVQGVSKRQLAKYVRSLPGRGGVGTYCHTKSVHVDVGRKRDWNRRCRRSRKRKS